MPKHSKGEKDEGSTEDLGKSSDDQILRKRGYVLSRILGEGSYAKVYLAEYADAKDSEKRQRLACKVINGNIAPRDFLRRFFPREVEIMSRVNHQYLVRVHSILQRKQKYFLFMQFCENGDLLDFIRKNGAIRERQARVWFCQLLRGVHYLHERNIAHRDLKCENVLLTTSYNIKISDFGFARYMLPEDVKSETFCGSVSYAAPEIIKGIAYDPKGVDIWSLGVILFVMLNKSMPFDDTSLRKLYESQLARNWKFRNKLKDLLTLDVKNYLYTVMEPDMARRKSVTQLWDEAWIQKGSNIDLDIKGPQKHTGGLMNKKESKLREKLAQEKLDKDIARDQPVQIIDADTAKVRRASFFLKEYQETTITLVDTPTPATVTAADVRHEEHTTHTSPNENNITYTSPHVKPAKPEQDFSKEDNNDS